MQVEQLELFTPEEDEVFEMEYGIETGIDFECADTENNASPALRMVAEKYCGRMQRLAHVKLAREYTKLVKMGFSQMAIERHAVIVKIKAEIARYDALLKGVVH